jgi:hypothetical protein
MKQFKMFADFDKEEAWLNQKAAEGWLLSKVGMRYTFEPIEPGRAVVRVDQQPSMSVTDFDDYRNLFWDGGWKHVAGSPHSGAQYFASFSGDANADIFSDSQSRAERYKRAMAMTSLILLPLLVVMITLWGQGILPDELYLTPDLWEKEGWAFVRAFVFETPFALMRLGAPLLLALSCMILIAQIFYQWMLYRRALR